MTGHVYFKEATAPDAVSFRIKLEATWTIGIAYPEKVTKFIVLSM